MPVERLQSTAKRRFKKAPIPAGWTVYFYGCGQFSACVRKRALTDLVAACLTGS